MFTLANWHDLGIDLSQAQGSGYEHRTLCPKCSHSRRKNTDRCLAVNIAKGICFCHHCGWSGALGYGKAKAKDYRAPPASRPPAAPPTWQTQAKRVIDRCREMLWSPKGTNALTWLHKRGLENDTLRRWRVGYNPKDCRLEGMWVCRGIVLPCIIAGTVWYIKIRRAEGNPKYQHVKGSQSALCGADTLVGHDIAVLVEGEFDAMLLHQQVGDLAGVATLGSAGQRLQVATWASYLLPVSWFLVAYDGDDAGRRGAKALTAVSPRMQQVQVPRLRDGDTDLTDYHLAGGDLRAWLTFELIRLNGMPTMRQTVVACRHDGEIAVRDGMLRCLMCCTVMF